MQPVAFTNTICITVDMLGSISSSSSPDQPSKERLDTIVAAAASQLNAEQTLSAQEDMYGVVRQVPEQEQPEKLRAMLQILRARMGAVKLKRGTAYEIAERIDRTYVDHEGFLLQFLRANKYDPEQAAKQIIRFFNVKLELFGREKLVKDITLDDLDDDDQHCLNNGSNQVAQTEGRHIFVCLPGLRQFRRLNNELRARYYVLMSMLESKETQLNGVTIITYEVGSCKDTTNGTGYIEHTRLLQSLPIHVAAIHHCCDDPAQYLLQSASIRLLSTSQLARFQTHIGSAVQCTYKLATFGIPSGSLPLSPVDHQPNMDRHMKWLRTRRVIESQKKKENPAHPQFVETRLQPSVLQRQDASISTNNSSITNVRGVGNIQPNGDDVLFGQEHKAHPGNMKMHQLMDHLQDEYESADKQGKMKFSLIVVFSMKGTGSRFLDFDETTMQWHIVPDTVARNKVAKAIRNRRRYKVRQDAINKEKSKAAKHARSASLDSLQKSPLKQGVKDRESRKSRKLEPSKENPKSSSKEATAAGPEVVKPGTGSKETETTAATEGSSGTEGKASVPSVESMESEFVE
eukprot:scaffold3987_cov134-Cylindrotheca_fusiformis.AAC.16